MVPDLGESLLPFIALAQAVYAGPHTSLPPVKRMLTEHLARSIR